MNKIIHAIYENGVFRPTDPIDLPDSCEVELVVHAKPSVTAESTLAKLAEFGRQGPENPDLPDDLAVQHDHYLYGTPKK